MKYFAVLILVFMLFSCEQKNIDKIDWLEGTWTEKFDDHKVTERWERKGNKYIGVSYYSQNRDSTIQETVEIVENKSNKLCFNVKVSDQNNGEKITFCQKEITKNSIVFSNPEHDFPQNIKYSKVKDSLIVNVSGIRDGENLEFRIAYIKVK